MYDDDLRTKVCEAALKAKNEAALALMGEADASVAVGTIYALLAEATCSN